MQASRYLAVLVGAASLGVTGAGHAVERGRASDVRAIQQIEQDFTEAWARDDANGMAAVFASDGDLINPKGDRARGHAEILKLFQREHSAQSPLAATRFTSDCEEPKFLSPTIATFTCPFTVENVKVGMNAPQNLGRQNVAGNQGLGNQGLGSQNLGNQNPGSQNPGNQNPSSQNLGNQDEQKLGSQGGQSLGRQPVAGGGQGASTMQQGATLRGIQTVVLTKQGGRWLVAVGRPMLLPGSQMPNVPSANAPSPNAPSPNAPSNLR